MKFIRRNIIRILIGLGLLALAFLVARKFFFKPAPNIYNPSTDTVLRAQPKDINETLDLAGSIDAYNKAELHFQTSGLLTWVGVRVGDRVKKWQTVATLDRKALQKQLQKSLNDYLTNRSTFNDTQDQYVTQLQNNPTDELHRLLARSQYSLNNSVIAVELNDIAIKYSSIFTPIDGIVVVADPPQAGVNISPVSATYTVIDPNSIYFKAKIAQEDVDKIHLGQSATLSLDSQPDQKLDSTINFIAFTPVAGESSTVYEIRLNLPSDNQDLKYRLGMDGNASIILASAQNTLTLSSDAINDDNGQKFVWVKTGTNSLEKRNVTIGIINDTDTQIRQGVSLNDQVVIKKQ